MGLEIGLSVIHFNKLTDCWSTNAFKGHKDFKRAFSRSRFLEIRASIKFHAKGEFTSDYKVQDPLWHSRNLLTEFQRNCQKAAVPLFASTLDENSCLTKARTKAKIYLPPKPDKYAIRFYCVVDWKHCYLHSVFDNGSGNSEPDSSAERYLNIFPEMRRPIHRFCATRMSSASTLWTAMVAHQSKALNSPSKKRICYMDNFYTRQDMSSSIHQVTDGEMKVIGTVRRNYIDAVNKPFVERAYKIIEKGRRNDWILVHAHELEIEKLSKTKGSKKKRAKEASEKHEREKEKPQENHKGIGDLCKNTVNSGPCNLKTPTLSNADDFGLCHPSRSAVHGMNTSSQGKIKVSENSGFII